MKNTLALLSIVASLAACGGVKDSQPTNSSGSGPTPPVTTPPSPPQDTKTLVVQSAEFAQVVSVDLAELGLPSTLTAADFAAASGNVKNLTIRDGQLRFITGSDNGADEEALIRTTGDGKPVNIPFLIRSSRPTEFTEDIHADDDSTSGPAAPLIAKGVGEANIQTAADISFTVQGAPTFSTTASSASIQDADGNVTNLAALWSYDTTSNTFVVPAAKMTALLNALPNSSLSISVGLASKDGKFAKAYTFLAAKATAALNGTVIDTNGRAVTTLAGRLVALRGTSDGVRRVVEIDSSGKFTMPNLIADTYEASILDTAYPGFSSASVPINPSTKTASVTIVYAALSR